MIARKRYISFASCLFLVAVSCTQRTEAPEKTVDTISITTTSSPLLWTDDELSAESHSDKRAEELFDDFLYNYVQDTVMQRERAVFPIQELQLDGSTHNISEAEWSRDYRFTPADYTTTLYNSEAEMSINEDTALQQASVEKIYIERQYITAYDFTRNNKRWNLISIRNLSFADSDLKDFLQFYSRFATDEAFSSKSLSRSIHISITDPDDESQNIEGFINREQWPTVAPVLPDGVIMNVRYGQQYQHSRRILMEKTSMGDGMSETLTFAKGNRGWELVGYEN